LERCTPRAQKPDMESWRCWIRCTPKSGLPAVHANVL